jgi:hypothetical protein
MGRFTSHTQNCHCHFHARGDGQPIEPHPTHSALSDLIELVEPDRACWGSFMHAMHTHARGISHLTPNFYKPAPFARWSQDADVRVHTRARGEISLGPALSGVRPYPHLIRFANDPITYMARTARRRLESMPSNSAEVCRGKRLIEITSGERGEYHGAQRLLTEP